MRITRVLTDAGNSSNDRLFCLRKRSPTGQHEFDPLCAEIGIKPSLAPSIRPLTIGMFERLCGRGENVQQSHRLKSGKHLEQTIFP